MAMFGFFLVSLVVGYLVLRYRVHVIVVVHHRQGTTFHHAAKPSSKRASEQPISDSALSSGGCFRISEPWMQARTRKESCRARMRKWVAELRWIIEDRHSGSPHVRADDLYARCSSSVIAGS